MSSHLQVTVVLSLSNFNECPRVLVSVFNSKKDDNGTDVKPLMLIIMIDIIWWCVRESIVLLKNSTTILTIGL